MILVIKTIFKFNIYISNIIFIYKNITLDRYSILNKVILIYLEKYL